MSSIIPLLTEYEKQNLSERQALPEKFLGLSDEEMMPASPRHARRSETGW